MVIYCSTHCYFATITMVYVALVLKSSLLHGRQSPDSPAEQQTHTDETHHALSTETELTAMES